MEFSYDFGHWKAYGRRNSNTTRPQKKKMIMFYFSIDHHVQRSALKSNQKNSLMDVKTTLCTYKNPVNQDIVWTSIRRFLNVMDVKTTLYAYKNPVNTRPLFGRRLNVIRTLWTLDGRQNNVFCLYWERNRFRVIKQIV